MERSDFTQSEGFLDSFDPDVKRAFEVANNEVDPELVDYKKVQIRKDAILLSGDGAFYTLQGEGPTMGLPCVFLRLHHCNLRCVWCDAYYTWNNSSREFWTESRHSGFSEAADLIKRTWEGPEDVQKRVIITGGEPLMQRKQLDSVIEFLTSDWEIEFETNGTLMPTEKQLANDQFNVSPKLANSENKDYTMVKPKILSALNSANSTFKFVCYNESDLDEIEEKYLPHISKDKVIIMPQGVTEDEITMNARRLAEPVKQRGYRMMPRAQAIFWDGARRRV